MNKDKFGLTLIISFGIFIGLILIYAIPRDIALSNRAEMIANEMGCIVIGSARDLNSVKFLDCNGEVKLIRVQ